MLGIPPSDLSAPGRPTASQRASWAEIDSRLSWRASKSLCWSCTGAREDASSLSALASCLCRASPQNALLPDHRAGSDDAAALLRRLHLPHRRQAAGQADPREPGALRRAGRQGVPLYHAGRDRRVRGDASVEADRQVRPGLPPTAAPWLGLPLQGVSAAAVLPAPHLSVQRRAVPRAA